MPPRTAAAAAAFLVLSAAGAAVAAVAAPTPAPMPYASPTTQPVSNRIPMSLTLSQAEQIARASSPALALARGQLESALGGIGTAQAGELPNISGLASTGRAK